MFKEIPEFRKKFRGKKFWAKGYFVSTIRVDERIIRQYVRKREMKGRRAKQLDIDWQAPPMGAPPFRAAHGPKPPAMTEDALLLVILAILLRGILLKLNSKVIGNEKSEHLACF
jgi:hypothetical protein